MIPYGKHEILDEDILAVVNCLKSTHLTQGHRIQDFERSFANYVGSKYAVAVSNGTAALHLSLIALDLKPGEKVIVPTITFSATANAVKYCGAEVVFCDIDRETYLIDIQMAEKLLENDSSIRGIIPVNFAGKVVDFEKLQALKNKYDIWILEDSCHSPGGFFKGQNGKIKSGEGVVSDLSIFSFHPVKHIAAGEGGMITSNNTQLIERILNLRTHGIQQNRSKLIYDHSPWYYEMQELGYNYRLTDIQSSLGLSQLNRAKENLERRKEIAKRYNEGLNSPRIQKNSNLNWDEGHAYHLYVIEVEDRLSFYNYLKEHSIIPQIHYVPVHKMPYYRNNYPSLELSNSESYYRSCITIPLYPSLLDHEIDYVIETINKWK